VPLRVDRRPSGPGTSALVAGGVARPMIGTKEPREGEVVSSMGSGSTGSGSAGSTGSGSAGRHVAQLRRARRLGRRHGPGTAAGGDSGHHLRLLRRRVGDQRDVLGWATQEGLQPNIDGVSRDQVLLSSGVTTALVVLDVRYLAKPAGQPKPPGGWDVIGWPQGRRTHKARVPWCAASLPRLAAATARHLERDGVPAASPRLISGTPTHRLIPP
jgi:hypothetical protein